MVQGSFFNTIHYTGEALKAEIENCNAQEGNILMVMATGQEMTPFDVYNLYNILFNKVPITSIRRAMTCLTEKGYLIKSDKMKDGEYGKKNHCWVKK